MSSKSSSTVSLSSTQAETPKPVKWMFGLSPISTTTSSSRRCCRICQMSDEGDDMVRPCDCMGTVGDVHVACLTKWVNMSGKKDCEICKATYAKSGEVFKPIRQWTKPTNLYSILHHVMLIICFILLTLYMILLTKERRFFERMSLNMTWKPDDTGRACLTGILITSGLINLISVLVDFCKYLRSQREIRFINKHD